MIDLHLILDGDGCWPDLKDKEVIHVTHGLEIAGLAAGTGMGNPSVSFRLDLPDGRVVLAETSLKLLLTAVGALRARYGDPR